MAWLQGKDKVLSSPNKLWLAALGGGALAAIALYQLYRRNLSSSQRWKTESSVNEPPPRAFDLEIFKKALRTKILGRVKFQHYEEIGSTMTEAAKALNEQGPNAHGQVFFAEHQTAGQGRRGRGWEGSARLNIYVSFVWIAAPFNVSEYAKLNFAVAIAVAKACRTFGAEAMLKWPNDVWLNEKKLCGMLLNVSGTEGAVIGVGINVLQSMQESAPGTAISLKDAGFPLAREALLARFFHEFELLAERSFQQVLEEYDQYNMLRGRMVRVHHKTREVADERDYDAVVDGIGADGTLLVRNSVTGEQVALSSAEISISPK